MTTFKERIQKASAVAIGAKREIILLIVLIAGGGLLRAEWDGKSIPTEEAHLATSRIDSLQRAATVLIPEADTMAAKQDTTLRIARTIDAKQDKIIDWIISIDPSFQDTLRRIEDSLDSSSTQ